jgi:hypothetical protein
MRCSELLRASQPVLPPAEPPRPLSAQAAPPSAVAELGVVRRCSHIVKLAVIAIGIVSLTLQATAQRPSGSDLDSLLDPPARPLPEGILAAMTAASSFTLYSLDPDGGMHPDQPKTFRGWRVLGQTQVVDAPTRKRIATTIADSVARTRGLGMGCFIPHHGLRFIAHKHTYDFVICFHCEHLYIYAPNRDICVTRISTGAEVLDAIFSAAHIPMAERRK